MAKTPSPNSENPSSRSKVVIDRLACVEKRHIPLSKFKTALTFRSVTGLGPPITAYTEDEDLFYLPRHFLSPSQWTGMGLDVEVAGGCDHPARYLSSIQPRDQTQIEAIQAMTEARGGILELACGKGKTVIALAAIAARSQRACIIVPSVILRDQWVNSIERFLGVKPGIVQGDRAEWSDIVVCMAQTLSMRDYPPETFDSYGMVVFDEAHHLAAPLFNELCAKFRGDRFGLTATVRREDGLEALYLYHLGPVFYSDLSMDLPPRVVFYHLPTTVRRTGDVHAFRSAIAADELRNSIVLDTLAEVVSQGRKVLVLGHLIEHLERLHRLVPDSGLLVGKIKAQDRAATSRGAVLFATLAIAKEGFDVPAFDTLFLISPFRAEGAFIQSLGRIARAHEGKKAPLAIIFADPSASAVLSSFRRILREKKIETLSRYLPKQRYQEIVALSSWEDAFVSRAKKMESLPEVSPFE